MGHTHLSLEDAAPAISPHLGKCSPQRPNLDVGPPFELAVIPTGSLAVTPPLKPDADAPELAAMVDIGVMPSVKISTACPHRLGTGRSGVRGGTTPTSCPASPHG